MKTLEDLSKRIVDMLNSNFDYKDVKNILKLEKWHLHKMDLNTHFIGGLKQSNIVSYDADCLKEEGIYRLTHADIYGAKGVYNSDSIYLLSDDGLVSVLSPDKVINALIAQERAATIKMILGDD
jgi:hypothetical protein